MRAGQMRMRCEFERRVEAMDDLRDALSGGWEPFHEDVGDLRLTPGREAVAAGRLESVNAGTLRVRQSNRTRAVTTDMRVRVTSLQGVETLYAIRAVIDPDQRGDKLDFVVESGVAA
jgi:head-tail adaptor